MVGFPPCHLSFQLTENTTFQNNQITVVLNKGPERFRRSVNIAF